ncbi:nicotinate-nucleotide--dimethylbenzimidazole phosphoribosyltransferase [Blautia liquoris]|uniref:Nicotinate-nucleotide--dimethylbenzimidazole phosphoribosyltransferase n=1 Tax=Blautia liquoris TaxID=2779518 RepID=A0A7M2RKR9_9FIRM|nr:nicotinate-nucleotide--dimethylbenzimidazole phosphoribosyltransferase [Blautia liquoris]QOV20594.1 nicotinate-nucleotide--dimethylbenzimidazole phosphoribosyltransferase [Blautia liquoris]
MELQKLCEKIERLDLKSMKRAVVHWDSIAKPLHSLGKLEDVIVQIAGIQGTEKVHIARKALVILCADNGVVEEGVTQTGQEVTAIVSENFLTDKATAAILCQRAGADLLPVDMGIARDTNLRNCKIAYGTKNMAKGPAMTRAQAIQGIETGILLVKELKNKGYDILATGEMGIGNTTSSSAVVSVLLDKSVEEVTGRGAGLSGEGLNRKIITIKKAIELNNPDREDTIDVLAKVGGFDLAGMTGVFLGGACYHIPVVIDGFISLAAALCASRISPITRDYMIASHVSKEPATKMLLEALHKDAFLTCDMCLGEGTGAVTLFPILDMACEVYDKMSTFKDNSIEAYQPLE